MLHAGRESPFANYIEPPRYLVCVNRVKSTTTINGTIRETTTTADFIAIIEGSIVSPKKVSTTAFKDAQGDVQLDAKLMHSRDRIAQ